jgi:hypothetical protein
MSMVLGGGGGAGGGVITNCTDRMTMAPPLVAVNVILAKYVPTGREPVTTDTGIVVLPRATNDPDVGVRDNQPVPIM